MHKRPTPLNRIEALEQQIRALEAQLNSLRREPAGGTPHFVRIGKTTTDGEASYPEAPANTYGVVLQEATFTSEPGDQTRTVTDLSAAQQIVAHDLVDDRLLPEDTQVVVLKQPNGKHVLWPLLSTSTSIRIGRVDEVSGIPGRETSSLVCSSGTVDLWEINDSHTLTATGESVEAYNITSFKLSNVALVVLLESGGKTFIVEQISPASNRAVNVYYNDAAGWPVAGGTAIPMGANSSVLGLDSGCPIYQHGNGLKVHANRGGIFQVGFEVEVRAPSSPTILGGFELLAFRLFVNGVGQSRQITMSFVYPDEFGTSNPTWGRQRGRGSDARVIALSAGATLEIELSGSQVSNTLSDYDVMYANLWAVPVGEGELVEDWA